MTAAMPEGKEIFSTGELAEICRVTKRTIIAAIDKGDLKASRTPGGHNRIFRQDALEFLQRCGIIPKDRRRILVVDEEDFVHEVIRHVLGDSGNEILHARGSYEAGKLAERSRPDLIILGIGLANADGMDICKHLREEDFGKSCRILALTAAQELDAVQKRFSQGIDDFLAKPFRIETLREKVEHLMEANLV